MMETKKSFCRFCHASCGIEVDVEDNRVLAVRGDPDNVVSEGYTCIKGRAELERIYHPDRLLAPQKITDGRRIEIPADQALDEIAAKLKEIIERHGPRSVAAYVGCGGYRNSAGGPWYASKFIEALGSPSMYTCFTIDSPGFSVAATVAEAWAAILRRAPRATAVGLIIRAAQPSATAIRFPRARFSR